MRKTLHAITLASLAFVTMAITATVSANATDPLTELEPMYLYRAEVVSVYDGDTIRADIDLGFGVWKHNESLRLYGIDAPEVRGAERESGLFTRDWLRAWLPGGEEIRVRTFKDKQGKYGRYLAVIYARDETGAWIDLNAEMVSLGLAIVYGDP